MRMRVDLPMQVFRETFEGSRLTHDERNQFHLALTQLRTDVFHPGRQLKPVLGAAPQLFSFRVTDQLRGLVGRQATYRFMILGVFHREDDGHLPDLYKRWEINRSLVRWAREHPHELEPNPAPAAFWTTSMASRLAGQRRSHLRDEWAAILAGSHREGAVFSPGYQLRLALGFMLAAVRMRSHDVARPAWRPVDWVLRVQSRTNAFITAVLGAQAIYIVRDGGLGALATEVWDPCGAAGASLFLLARWLRRVRGIELATPESEPADE
ncbi:hypothetical protein [Streptomyces sp. NPDC091299]